MEGAGTKHLIADKFIEMSMKKDPNRISVRDISNELGINRKTFYYHFPSKEVLIFWIFRRDVGRALKDRFPQSLLVFEPKDSTPYAKYPYYVFISDENGRLRHEDFFILLSECLEARPYFYPALLKDSDLGSLQAYAFDLYNKAMYKDIEHIFEGTQIDPEAISFASEFYTAAFLGQITRRIISTKDCRTRKDLGPFDNIIHGSLYLIRREVMG